jgi:hypothetical protein
MLVDVRELTTEALPYLQGGSKDAACLAVWRVLAADAAVGGAGFGCFLAALGPEFVDGGVGVDPVVVEAAVDGRDAV